jgi:hypothetical protein
VRIPIINKTEREKVLGLEPEGETIPFGPGQILIVKTNEQASGPMDIEIDFEDDILSISILCDKEVWLGDVRLS